MQKQVWKTSNLSAVKSFAQDTWWKWRRYRLAPRVTYKLQWFPFCVFCHTFSSPLRNVHHVYLQILSRSFFVHFFVKCLWFIFLIRGLQLALVTPFSTISGLWHFDTCICRLAVLGFFTIWWIFGCSCFQWGVQLACSLRNFLQKNCTLQIRFLHCGLWSFF